MVFACRLVGVHHIVVVAIDTLFDCYVIGSIMLEDPRMGAAAVFYLVYIGGVLWFVSIPALAAGAPSQAFLTGCILGILAYGTYEFTNFATIRDWSMQMVMVDVVWGAVLTGSSAWAGVLITKTFVA